jgi:hypothetical protein
VDRPEGNQPRRVQLEGRASHLDSTTSKPARHGGGGVPTGVRRPALHLPQEKVAALARETRAAKKSPGGPKADHEEWGCESWT